MEFFEKAFDNKEYSKYYFTTDYFVKPVIYQDESYGFYYVSIDDKNNIIGYVGCEYCKDGSYSAESFKLINFTEKPSYIFAKDVFCFVDKLFNEIKIDHMSWWCMKGNPAEKIYDKFIKKYNGDKSSVIPRCYYTKSYGYRDACIYSNIKQDRCHAFRLACELLIPDFLYNVSTSYQKQLLLKNRNNP